MVSRWTGKKYNHVRASIMSCFAKALTVVRPISQHLLQPFSRLFQKSLPDLCIGGWCWRELGKNDLLGIEVEGNVKLTPRPALVGAVLSDLPLALSLDFQTIGI
jgi:hypothetical protein